MQLATRRLLLFQCRKDLLLLHFDLFGHCAHVERPLLGLAAGLLVGGDWRWALGACAHTFELAWRRLVVDRLRVNGRCVVVV